MRRVDHRTHFTDHVRILGIGSIPRGQSDLRSRRSNDFPLHPPHHLLFCPGLATRYRYGGDTDRRHQIHAGHLTCNWPLLISPGSETKLCFFRLALTPSKRSKSSHASERCSPSFVIRCFLSMAFRLEPLSWTNYFPESAPAPSPLAKFFYFPHSLEPFEIMQKLTVTLRLMRIGVCCVSIILGFGEMLTTI